MKKEVEIEECRVQDLSEEDRMLREKSIEAASRAYAPYSNFHVGAALLLQGGEVLQASNQENAAYPSGLCAERNVIYFAGANRLDSAPMKLAIVALQKGKVVEEPATPCGACLQAMWEYQQRFSEKLELLLIGVDNCWRVQGVGQLLPFAFRSLEDFRK